MPVYTFSDSSSGSQLAANGETLTADQAQDNPVGITEKYIYIIRNYINDKVYIGQAIDPQKRFDGHIHNSAIRSERSAIDSAIKKYGAENFYYEILEDKTANYNELEKFWIGVFNSISPNGYNIMPGGEEPPVRRGFDNNMSKFTHDSIRVIYKLLRGREMSMVEIAQAFGVTYHTIQSINVGRTYRQAGVSYPIRNIRLSGEHDNVVSQKVVNAIIRDLLFTGLLFSEIARDHGVKEQQVCSINNGAAAIYRRDNLTYPIRKSYKVDKKQEGEIKKLLIEGVLSKNQIAASVGVSYAAVSNINAGRSHFDPDMVYPLKKHEGRYDYDESVWEEIRSSLMRGDNPKTIASKMHLPNVSMVYDINVGKTHRSEKYTYPIQKPIPRFSDDIILEITQEICSSSKSLSQIAREYGIHKSSVVQLKNGKWEKYKLPGYTYPLR